jgi:signal transduction histidine kinase
VTALLEPDLMESVCLNLLDNARKAMEHGGEVLLEGLPEEGGCLIQVTDQGKGIPPEELERVTEAFYMVDKSRARAQGGAGLGLALCRRIAELHGGTLELESELGRGTRVRVHLKGGEEPPCETGKTGSSPS